MWTAKCLRPSILVLALGGSLLFSNIARGDGRRVKNAQSGAVESKDDPVEWKPVYSGPCSVGCGIGVKTLDEAATSCQYAGAIFQTEAPKEDCTGLAKPPATEKCEETDACEWKVANAPVGRCGWADVQCADGSSGVPDANLMPFCEKKTHMPGNSFLEFQARHARIFSDECRSEDHEPMKSLCTVTLNQPYGSSPTARLSSAFLDEAKGKAVKAIAGCDDAGIIVFATQELTMRWGEMFSDFADYVASSAITPKYTEVARCGGTISPGVVVLVKTDMHKYFQPGEGLCTTDDGLYGGKSAHTNTKGTAFLEMFTVFGPFVAASTHGQRGGVYSEPRVQQIEAATANIKSMNPAIVAWGGDFNLRTQVTDDDTEILQKGTTHPLVMELGPNAWRQDPNAGDKDHWDARAVHTALMNKPDLLGGADGKTFAEVLTAASDGNFMQVPNIREKLCPSYRKSNHGEFKATKMLLLADGTEKKKGWSTPKGAHVIEEWIPSLGCSAPDSSEIEFYLSPKNGKTKWPDHAPSWCERLIVHSASTGAGTNCHTPKKVIAPDDHDTVYAKCDLTLKPV